MRLSIVHPSLRRVNLGATLTLLLIVGVVATAASSPPPTLAFAPTIDTTPADTLKADAEVWIVTTGEGGRAQIRDMVAYGYVELYLDPETEVVLPDTGPPYPTITISDSVTTYEGSFTLQLTEPGQPTFDLVVENGKVEAYASRAFATAAGARRD